MTDETADVRAEVFPMARTCPFAPPEEYRTIRTEQPVARVRMPGDRWAWVITRHEDVSAMLVDPRFSSDRRDPRFPAQVLGSRPGEDDRRIAKSLITMDGPEHARVRRAVLGEFSPRRMEALRPRIQRIVDERIDAVLAGPRPVDLVRELSLPVPSTVICELLGVPSSDDGFFQEQSARMLDRSTPGPERIAALMALEAYLDDLVTAKERNPTEEDLLGRQILRGRAAGDYRHGELAELAYLLLLAGYETTANMISLGVVALLENPGQLERIRADPARTPAAVEELLRYFTIAEFTAVRLAIADVEIGGVSIGAGEGVLGLTYSANRDPDVFENPDDLDVERGARRHLAFGLGPHQCLGQSLARIELQVVLDTLFRRIPDLGLAVPVADLPFKDNVSVYGLHALPVTW
ncbi:cytochrome P450 [Streptosporangium oxazolinicum]|uniref:Cytochrome P450 n=1 Tax=Streptosporangium oxazolinicum TaxID=909287 RepID=A0ABP8AWA2_9ACTN